MGECLLICWLNCEACRAIRYAPSMLSLVNMILKDTNVVFYLSVTNCFTLQTSDYDVIIDLCVDSAS